MTEPIGREPGTVLVAGAGQIGCWTAAQLRAPGQRVLLVDVRAPSAEVVAFARLKEVPFRPADVTDFDQLDGLCAAIAVDRVVHTAALLSSSIRAVRSRGRAPGPRLSAGVAPGRLDPVDCRAAGSGPSTMTE